MKRTLLSLSLMFIASAAVGQPTDAAVQKCAALTDDQDRLSCFDNLAKDPASSQTLDRQCCWRWVSDSMKPTLQKGELVAASKYVYPEKPRHGDVVVFRLPRDPSTIYIKRVIGIPGDRVQMIDGTVHLNGKPLVREQIEDLVENTEGGRTTRVKRWREVMPNGTSYNTPDLVAGGFYDDTPVYPVPDLHYFVIGDNRDNSTDSRVLSQIGFIPEGNIIGRAISQISQVDRSKLSGAADDTVKDVPKQAKQVTSAPVPAQVDMIDFLVDGKQWLAKKVVVTGCGLTHAGNISTCQSPAGYFFVTSYANKEDLRDTMRRCAGGTQCPVKISGIVETYAGSLALANAEIIRE